MNKQVYSCSRCAGLRLPEYCPHSRAFECCHCFAVVALAALRPYMPTRAWLAEHYPGISGPAAMMAQHIDERFDRLESALRNYKRVKIASILLSVALFAWPYIAVRLQYGLADTLLRTWTQYWWYYAVAVPIAAYVALRYFRKSRPDTGSAPLPPITVQRADDPLSSDDGQPLHLDVRYNVVSQGSGLCLKMRIRGRHPTIRPFGRVPALVLYANRTGGELPGRDAHTHKHRVAAHSAPPQDEHDIPEPLPWRGVSVTTHRFKLVLDDCRAGFPNMQIARSDGLR